MNNNGSGCNLTRFPHHNIALQNDGYILEDLNHLQHNGGDRQSLLRPIGSISACSRYTRLRLKVR